MGVLTAKQNVNGVINEKLKGMDATNQGLIDKTMVDMDGTPNKSKLGSNAMLSVSLAVAVALANHKRIPLYRYLNSLTNTGNPDAITDSYTDI